MTQNEIKESLKNHIDKTHRKVSKERLFVFKEYRCIYKFI